MNKLEQCRNSGECRCCGRRRQWGGVFRDDERCGRKWLRRRALMQRHDESGPTLTISTNTRTERNSARRRWAEGGLGAVTKAVGRPDARRLQLRLRMPPMSDALRQPVDNHALSTRTISISLSWPSTLTCGECSSCADGDGELIEECGAWLSTRLQGIDVPRVRPTHFITRAGNLRAIE